jgi:hypothetical protein
LCILDSGVGPVGGRLLEGEIPGDRFTVSAERVSAMAATVITTSTISVTTSITPR